MLRYRRGALDPTRERNLSMQHENLTVATPPQEPTFTLCARRTSRTAAREVTEKTPALRLFED